MKKWIPWGTPKPVEHTIDPATGIWPISEWGASCGRGFVGNDRFAQAGEQVIKRSNRSKQRKGTMVFPISTKQKGTRDG